ncbi:Ig-like domain-containing protein [Mameliella alba]|nr:Ig-like domain-containing protein [Antarctobacter heliothermus]MBY6143044.1 Ig-like domain-containing protein [Mameliella alba]MCA0953232.1 Ig-like domain-containing protein [Mameliella alba]
MNAIKFVTRTRAGIVERGAVDGDEKGFLINAAGDQDISLNISQSDVRGYDRAGDDLLITLADGRVIVLEGYFESDAGRLFLSSYGSLNEVSFVEADGGALFAQYGPTEEWGKWSPEDALIFIDEPTVVAEAPIVADDGSEVSMLAAGLIGMGGLGAAGLGAAALGGAALLGGSGGGGGGGGGSFGWTPPTVDDPDASYDIAGGDTPSITITGTANPGSVVEVTIGGVTLTGIAGDDRTWQIVFDGENFPPDGIYENIPVVVTDPDGTVTNLYGPSFEIDTTPPPVDVTDGTVSTGVLVNADDQSDGVTVTGKGEPGTTITITVDDTTQTGVVDENGDWSFDFDGTVFPEGTYDKDITLVSTDGFGNSTTVVDVVAVDTQNSVHLTNLPLTGDDLIGQVEADAGVTFTGTTDAGSTVTVTVEGVTVTATADVDGKWSVNFAAGDLPEGTYTTTAQIVSTDPAGNVATLNHSFDVDTEITLAVNTGAVGGDAVINGAEADAGVVVTGSAEGGATVVVSTNGTSFTTTADASGGWTIDIPSVSLPRGSMPLDITAAATDHAGNTITKSGTVSIDTEITLSLHTDTVEGDGVINAAEASDGTVLTGSAEAGASVVVTANGHSYTATADASGAWSVNIPAVNLPSGTTTMDISATATDAAGNTVTATGTVDIDTELALTIDTSALAVDGIINSTEHAGMVTFIGTGEPGATVTLELYGESVTAVVAADGSWSMPFPAHVLPTNAGSPDSIAVLATVTSTDPAGNMAFASGGFEIDVTNHVEVYTSSVESDGVVNAAERADGVLLTGYTEATDAGSSVTVTVNGTAYNATVDFNGNWSVVLPASEIPEGETSLDVLATSIDGAGNVVTATGTIQIDTTTNVAVMTTGVEGDGVVNAAERSDGVTLTGTAEAGSTVMVTLGTVTHQATVAADGSWSVDFAAAEIPAGERSLTVTATSTDPAGNTATANGTIDVDTLVRNFAITSTPGGADAVINADEAAQGLVLTGTTEPGGTVAITLNGHTVQATVDAGGNWTASFDPAQLPSGEQTVTLTAVSTDPAGNTETITQPVTMDTDAGTLTISPDPVETDDVVNFVEASDGVTIKGTSDPGQVVNVTMNGVTHAVLTDASGNWSVDYAPGEIAPGTYTADISATITDSAGNVLTRTDSVKVDTEVLNFAASTTPVEGDNVINANEASDGFVLTGTTEPGGTVSVTFEGVTRSATVDAAGNWSVGFGAGDIPAGEKSSSAVIDTTDAAGNTATTSVTFDIDTEVNSLAMSSDPVTPDGVINAAEAAQGVTLTGVVEQGSTVTVTVGGMAHVATVDASGNWSVDIASSAIPTGTLTAPVLIEAVDAAGNTRAINETLSIDTDAPDTLHWTGYGRDGSGVDLIRTEITTDDVFLGQLTDPAGTPDVTAVPIDTTTDIPAIGQSYIDLTGSVPDGTHLVLASTDPAGNTSGSYLVTDDPATNTVLMSDDIASALSEFQIDTIDLHFAEDSNLTITEAQIKALSDHTDTVVIRGGADDSVTITGATAEGNDGNGFNVFSLGDATLLIEDDITQVHGVT